MKNYLKNIKIYALGVCAIGALSTSCEEEAAFDQLDTVFESYQDGIQNLDEEGIDCGGGTGVTCPTCDDFILNRDEVEFDCGGAFCEPCLEAPRAKSFPGAEDLPIFFTFETDRPSGGKNLVPNFAYRTPPVQPTQTNDFFPGVDDPAGSDLKVGRIVRRDDGRAGGFEDFKFQPQPQNIDFSEFHKFKLDVFVPSSNDFTGTLVPQVELILHDNNDGNFWQRWTIITVPIDAADFDKWITLDFDGTNAVSTGVVGLPQIPLTENGNYNNYTIRFGGSGHNAPGEYYAKDFRPYK